MSKSVCPPPSLLLTLLLQTLNATRLIGPLKCHRNRYLTDCTSLPVAPTVFATPYRGPIRVISQAWRIHFDSFRSCCVAHEAQQADSSVLVRLMNSRLLSMVSVSHFLVVNVRCVLTTRIIFFTLVSPDQPVTDKDPRRPPALRYRRTAGSQPTTRVFITNIQRDNQITTRSPTWPRPWICSCACTCASLEKLKFFLNI